MCSVYKKWALFLFGDPSLTAQCSFTMVNTVVFSAIALFFTQVAHALPQAPPSDVPPTDSWSSTPSYTTSYSSTASPYSSQYSSTTDYYPTTTHSYSTGTPYTSSSCYPPPKETYPPTTSPYPPNSSPKPDNGKPDNNNPEPNTPSPLRATYDATFDNKAGSLNSVACSNGPNGLVSRFPTFGDIPNFPFIGGAFDVVWNSPNCGGCWNITNPTTGVSIQMTAIDTAAGGFNIAQEAFEQLNGGQIGQGVIDVVANKVAASVCGL